MVDWLAGWLAGWHVLAMLFANEAFVQANVQSSILFDIGGATIRGSSAAKDADWSLEWHELVTIGIFVFFGAHLFHARGLVGTVLLGICSCNNTVVKNPM